MKYLFKERYEAGKHKIHLFQTCLNYNYQA